MTRKDVLDLFQNCNFANEELTSRNCEEGVLNCLPKNFQFSYYFGASKLVLIPDKENFVIKIPFNGLYYFNEFHENWNACNDSTYHWDYCAAEALLYKKAKINHVEQAFCKTSFIGIINNHPIYIQQKAIPYNDIYLEDFAYSEIKSSKAKNISRKISWNSWWEPVWQTDAFEYYGEKKYKKLMNFIYNYGIYDLHQGNLGYIGQAPVLFDYSDFNE